MSLRVVHWGTGSTGMHGLRAIIDPLSDDELAALMTTNVNVQGLTVEAVLTRRREHLYHAAMLDPHTAAELDLDQIWSLVDDLLAAHGDSVGVWA